MLQKGIGETHPLSEVPAGLGSGFYPEGGENTSTESRIFKCASDVALQSKDRTAVTSTRPRKTPFLHPVRL